jgi:hypothetical protein
MGMPSNVRRVRISTPAPGAASGGSLPAFRSTWSTSVSHCSRVAAGNSAASVSSSGSAGALSSNALLSTVLDLGAGFPGAAFIDCDSSATRGSSADPGPIRAGPAESMTARDRSRASRDVMRRTVAIAPGGRSRLALLAVRQEWPGQPAG